MEPLRVSERNHRPRPIHRRAPERLRNAHLAGPSDRRGSGLPRPPVAECRAMTSTPHRSIRRPRVAPGAACSPLVAALRPGSPTPTTGSGRPGTRRTGRRPGRARDPGADHGRRRRLRRVDGEPGADDRADGAARARTPTTRTPPATRRSRARSARSAASTLNDARPARRRSTARSWARSSGRASRATTPSRSIAGTETLLKALLLMPQGDSLRDLYVEMLTSQIAGLYDDKTKTHVRDLRHGRDRPARGDHLRPRVHARAPGPGVRPRASSTAMRPTRATGRSRARRSSRATRRC